jgi:DNA invertase Pin-like site-specific DNA recombinase
VPGRRRSRRTPRGVDLVVLDQGIDTSTAVGRMFVQILGSIAEFEHALKGLF